MQEKDGKYDVYSDEYSLTYTYNGEVHRDEGDGPAIIYYEGFEDFAYYRHGSFHRENGAATSYFEINGELIWGYYLSDINLHILYKDVI